MGTIMPMATVAIIIICIPLHIAIYIVLSHMIEFTVIGIICGFRQPPTLRTDGTGSFIAIVVHICGGAGSGSSVGVVDTVSAIGT